MTALTWLGRHASALLLLGLVTVPFVPVSPERLKPLLPVLVSLVTALAIARQPLGRDDLARLFPPLGTARLVGWLIVSQLGFSAVAVLISHLLGIAPWLAFLPVAFFSTAPLGSAPNVAAMVRCDVRLALRLTLLGVVLAPVLMPLALSFTGATLDATPWEMARRVLAMLAAGIAGGIAIQRIAGLDRIERNTDVLNGLSALAMIGFLFPLLSGTGAAIAADPVLAAGLFTLACALNFGGHLVIRAAARHVVPPETAAAAGLVFGNRNMSIVLAALPFDPVLTLFVALAQVPIYATPYLFTPPDRRDPAPACPASSES
ncbi:hypothetical protein LVO79_09175 [Roseivivax marinus]|uniref:hypothetical protein n=1 Tax=Roseivivax marinus TaxID=1379903 RepID=UPI001F04F1E8|nr:hypothetical protein [Roseivivax marinus]UMA66587.1 hypothetical protein LVO79_09175 [Roseivivax marinus]